MQLTGRIAAEDVELGGKTHPRRASSVDALLGAANRDPAQFPDPDRLDIGRAATTATSPSATASTSASARRWPGWRARSPSRTLLRRLPDLRLATDRARLAR